MDSNLLVNPSIPDSILNPDIDKSYVNILKTSRNDSREFGVKYDF